MKLKTPKQILIENCITAPPHEEFVIEMMEKNANQYGKWILASERLPELNEEYLVAWDLDDGYDNLVVTSMDFNVKRQIWIDPRGSATPRESVIYWSEYPIPPAHKRPKRVETTGYLSVDDMERTIVYGQCRHGNNMASCSQCRGRQL